MLIRYLSPRPLDVDKVREEFLTSTHVSLVRRRRIILFSSLGLINAAVIALKQSGIISRLPDLPFYPFNANRVTVSKKAFALGFPDAAAASFAYGAIMCLASLGGLRRVKWVNQLLLIAVATNAVATLDFFFNMIFVQRRICLYCVTAAGLNTAMVPDALREANA